MPITAGTMKTRSSVRRSRSTADDDGNCDQYIQLSCLIHVFSVSLWLLFSD